MRSHQSWSTREGTRLKRQAVRVLLDETTGGQELAKLIPQELIHLCTVEDMVDVPVLVPIPQAQEQTGEVVNVIPGERVSECIREPIVDIPGGTNPGGNCGFSSSRAHSGVHRGRNSRHLCCTSDSNH